MTKTTSNLNRVQSKNDEVVQRLYSMYRKYNERLESRKYLAYQELLMTLKDKPDINKYKKRSESLQFIYSPERISIEIKEQKEKRMQLTEKYGSLKDLKE